MNLNLAHKWNLLFEQAQHRDRSPQTSRRIAALRNEMPPAPPGFLADEQPVTPEATNSNQPARIGMSAIIDLSAKTALVTSASEGIGAEIARTLHYAGCNAARHQPLEVNGG